ncbi:Centromere protein Scm3 N-terminal [Penicillium vulpinum]|uniref:Myb-like domain-containing protein n=1 Tax=Penicillium vulpinum TaxID=29845 RepID=A0A1V6RZR2_9EURO|nr:Centromere protein Scm3 N-terminal [Penicillium vulpinum]KAJ5971303.1 Centromere protein Scm3 N-terminal [Penicillium vulpinum]OQE07096.1 hypothetical protein PENVUL_c015G00689 [Penicillium vulpinum]
MNEPDGGMDHSIQDNMERPVKRPRLSYTPEDNEEPLADFDLPAARAQNDSRLKSLFEGIFAKYSHDFTDIGDEIDLQTGDIVVDNGHILGMRGEHGAGDQTQSWLSQAELDRSEESDVDDDNNTQVEDEEFFSMASSPGGHSPDALHDESPSKQLQTDIDSSLDFVFTFKASGTVGSSPTAKEEHVPHLTKPIPVSKPQDPLWAVPDLPPSFSTPTAETRKSNVGFSTPARFQSPPGSGSVWALRRSRRPRTETKPKPTPSKRRPAAKRKYHSSPVTRDWSFAALPDGNESDDPLQDYEPSPTPSKVKIIRGKRLIPTKEKDGPSTPSKKPAPVIKADDQGDDQEGGGETSDHDDDGPDAHLEEGNCGTSNEIDKVPEASLAEEVCEPNQQEYGVPEEQLPGGCGASDQEKEAPEAESENELLLDSIVQCDSTPKATTTASIQASSPLPMENTPSKRLPVTPDEAKLIVYMMYKQEKKASDVMQLLPGRDYHTVWHWFYNHWTRHLASPPLLSAAWSQPELAALSQLSTQSDLTWGQIQNRFKGRSRHEIEFELLRACVGEGFTSAMIGNVEEHVESEEEQQEETTEEDDTDDDEIKDESESDVGMDGIEDESGDNNAPSEDTAQEELQQPGIQETTDISVSKVSAPSTFLGIFI